MALAALLAINVNAQNNFAGTATEPGTVTTVSGLTTVELTSLDATIDTLNLVMSGAYNEVVTFQIRFLKAGSGGGTVAGTVRLYGSDYGATGTWDAVGDTLTLANQTVNSHTWTVTKPAYKFYRILRSGGTTMLGTISARAFGIKPN